MQPILSPSILSADFSKLGREIAAVARAGVDFLHIDVMDGLFVPSISFGMPVMRSIRPVSDLFFDVHLMIREPERFIKEFKDAGADGLTIHIESTEDPGAVLKEIRASGMQPGITLKPETPAEAVFSYLEMVDQILVMTVHPGFGGQQYMEACTPKITAIKEECERRGLSKRISVDGGVNLNNIDRIKAAGANTFVVGSAVFNGNPEENAKQFLAKLRQDM